MNTSIVKSFAVGYGDTFYIRHAPANLSIVDCCLSVSDRARFAAVIREIKGIATDFRQLGGETRFISTHPDDDHIRGLPHVLNASGARFFYCVENTVQKTIQTDDFKFYRQVREKKTRVLVRSLFRDCQHHWRELGDAGISILWPNTGNPEYQTALATANRSGEANNISPIIHYNHAGKISFLWMGDLKTDFMEKITDDVIDLLPKAHVLFAPHHSRKSGRVPSDWLKRINPDIIVVGEAPSEHLYYYPNHNTITQNSAGDIVFYNCFDGARSMIDVFVEKSYHPVDFLQRFNRESLHGLNYLGTLKIGF